MFTIYSRRTKALAKLADKHDQDRHRQGSALGSLVAPGGGGKPLSLPPGSPNGRNEFENTLKWRLRERQACKRGIHSRKASRNVRRCLVQSLEQPDQVIAPYGILSRIRCVG